MRKKLAPIDEQRLRFRATVERFGKKLNWKGYSEDTVLLKEVFIMETNELATDHIWFTVGKTWYELNLKPGDVIEFDARVGAYQKGYVHRLAENKKRKVDYKLNRPTMIKKIKT